MAAFCKKTILYSRLPGLLALAAHPVRPETHGQTPLVVSEGRLVCDAYPMVLTQGVHIGATVVQARRLCPTLIAVPLEQVDVSASLRRLLDTLADLSPVVEPDGLDAAYVDLMGSPLEATVESLRAQLLADFSLSPMIGLGVSRLAAHACAESGVVRLEDAAVEWLWPDDSAVVG